jgi:regulator of sigma E protease
MIDSLLTLLAAFLGLGVLIFLHEMGHFLVARACGITVEAFSIGFGRAIWSKKVRGVEWRIGVFPFGGYVRLAGMELTDANLKTPAPGTYFARPPWARIATIIAGPVANILVTLVCFTMVFLIGGRAKVWQEISPFVGGIPAHSPLKERKVIPGDRILSLDGRAYSGLRDLMMASITSGPLNIEAEGYSYGVHQRRTFSLQVKRSADHRALLWSPSQFLEIEEIDGATPLVEGSPLLDAGIQVGDRLVWLDGILLWSQNQISQTLNDGKVLLIIERDGMRTLTRVPRLQISRQSSVDPQWRDWWFSASSRKAPATFWALPVTLDKELRVVSVQEGGGRSRHQDFPWRQTPSYLATEGLQKNDRILAIDGVPVANGSELVTQLQNRLAHIIVQRPEVKTRKALSIEQAESSFIGGFSPDQLSILTQGFMSGERLLSAGEFVLLEPMAVKPLSAFSLSPQRADALKSDEIQRRRAILAIQQPEERAAVLAQFEKELKQNILGILPKGIQDQPILYNPNPWVLFTDACNQSWLSLKGLFSGRVGAENVSSPVGVFVAMKSSWETSFADGIYLLGFISFSLAVFNLLPIPVLDGGYVVLTLLESITRRRPSAKVLKWCFVPFLALLIGLMIFTVWNDLSAMIRGTR